MLDGTTDSRGTTRRTLGTVQLKHVPGFLAVTLTTCAPYGELAAPFTRLRTWAAHVGVEPIGSVMGAFYDGARGTGADTCRYSLLLPVSGLDADQARRALADGDPATAALGPGDVVEVREFPPVLAAMAYYRGPVSEAQEAYDQVTAWVTERPYLPTGAMREVFLARPGQLGDGLMEVELQQPVMPRK